MAMVAVTYLRFQKGGNLTFPPSSSSLPISPSSPTYSPFLPSLSPVILIDPSMGSPVHVLMLSIQAVRGLPGVVPGIIFLQATPSFPHGV